MKMLHYDRIDNKTSESKERGIFHYWYFLHLFECLQWIP